MRKALLNQFDDPRLSEQIWVGKGDKVYANHGAEDYGFTVGNQYEVHDVSIFGYLVMKNDKGDFDEYTVEYFRKYQPVV